MCLERILYCASSALVSAVATFSLTRFLQRRKKCKKQDDSAEPVLAARQADKESKDLSDLLVEKPTEKLTEKEAARDFALEEKEKQLLIAIARVKELESQLASVKEDKEAAEDACQDLEERLGEASKAVKDAKQELGKSAAAKKNVEASFASLLVEKEHAMDKIQALRREKADALKSESECRNSVTGLQRSLSNQSNDKKSAERLAKKLENELIEVKASRSRLEVHYKALLQKSEESLKLAEAAKDAALSDLAQYISQLSTARKKVADFGSSYLQMQQEHALGQDKLVEAKLKLQKESQKHSETTNGLRVALERIRELEKELRITRETARNQLKRSMSSLSSGSSSSQQQMRS